MAKRKKMSLSRLFSFSEYENGGNSLGLSRHELDPRKQQDTVIVTDRWGERKGWEVQRRLVSGKDPLPKEEATQSAVTDLFSSLFEPEPDYNTTLTSSAEIRKEFLNGLFENQDFQELREETAYHPWAAEVACRAITQQYVQYVQVVKQNGGCSQKQTQKAAQDAAKGAMQSLSGQQNVAKGFGLETGADNTMRLEEVKHILDAAMKDQNLKKIIEHAGKFRALATSLQKRKTTIGMDDVVGVTLSGELSRLIPQELLHLRHPKLKREAEIKLIENRSMSTDYIGIEKVSRGPIMVLVDESGSMQGEAIQTAKGVALAMAYVSKIQKRWCCLVGFSSDGDINPIVLDPNNWDQEAMLKWCKHFYNGGTVCPLHALEGLFQSTKAPRGKTDVLVVTDGEACINITQDDFQKWKDTNKAKLMSFIINCEGHTMEPYSDSLFKMKSISIDEDGVRQALSV